MSTLDLNELIDAAEAEAEPDEEEVTEAEQPEAEQPEAEQPEAEQPDPLSDEALANAEDLTAARDALRKQTADMNRERSKAFLQLRARTDRLKKRETKLAELERSLDQRELSAKKRRDGSPSEVLDALGEWYGADPIKALEMLNLAAAGRRPPDDEVLKIRKELQEFKEAAAKREQEAAAKREEESHDQLIERRRGELLEVAQQMPYAKLLIEDAPEESGAKLLRFKVEAYEAGKPITDEEAAAKLNAYGENLAKRFGAPGQAGSENAVKPGSLKATNKTLTSTQVSAQRDKRELTEDEYIAANAESILQDLGF